MKVDKYVIGLDLFRFLAAAAVLSLHLIFMIGIHGRVANEVTGGRIGFPEFGALPSYGWIGVQIFFVISGFVISMSAHGATSKKFLIGRILRLAPVAWICATATLVILVVSGIGSNEENLIRWLKSIFFSPIGEYIDHSYWTLGVEISFYSVVFAFVALRKFDMFPKFMIVVAIASAAFNVASLHFGFLKSPDRVTELLLLRYGVFFALGVGFYRFKQSGWDVVTTSLVIIGSLGSLFQIAWNLAFYDKQIDTLVLTGLLTFWLTLVVLLFISVAYNSEIIGKTKMLAGLMRTLGLITYPLYLIHQVVGALLIAMFIDIGFNKYAALLFGIAFVGLLSWAVVKIEPYIRRRLDPWLTWIVGVGEQKVRAALT